MTTTSPARAAPTEHASTDDAESDRRFALGLGLIALVAGLGRIWYLVASGVDGRPVTRQGDAFWYSTTAQNLAKGEVFINAFSGEATADHPPLTILVLGPTSWLFDQSTLAQRLTMVVLGTLAVAAIGMAGRRLAGRRVGLAAAAIAAVSPSLFVNDVLIMSEAVTALVLAVLLWAGIALAERPTLRLAALAGALCGLAALARAESALFLPLMVWPVIAFARTLGWRRQLAMAGLAALAAGAVIAPWSALNLTRFAEPVLISTNEGLTLAGANCDATYQGRGKGGWSIDPCVRDAQARIDAAKSGDGEPETDDPAQPCRDADQRRLPCLDDAQMSNALRAEAITYVRAHATEVPGVVLARNGRVWGVYQVDRTLRSAEVEGRPRLVGQLGFVGAWVSLPLSAAGLVILRRRRVSVVPFVAALVIVIGATSAFTGLAPRLRLPWDVASCLLMAVAVVALWDRARPRLPGLRSTAPARSDR